MYLNIVTSPLSLPETGADLYFENLVEFLEVKSMKVWVFSETGPPRVFNY